MKKNAVVFGITGQDGSYLTELLLEKNYDVIGVTRRVSTGNTGRIVHLMDCPHLHLVEGDLTDYSSILRIIEEYEPMEVYNLAAMSHVGTSFDQPLLSFDVTGKGCLNILEVLREHSPYTRFYQASSSEMFGDAFTEQGGNKFQDENTLFRPQSPYAIAKLAAHHATRLYRNSYSLHASCGILFNHESERRGGRFVTKKITKYVAQLYNHIQSGKDPKSHPELRLGNLDAQRDWGHAEDYVRAMWLILQEDNPDDYVIATGTTHSVREFLEAAFNKIGIENYMDFVVQDPKFMRPSEVPFLKGSAYKAKVVLGWRPKVDFEELVSRMVEYDIQQANTKETVG
jgi:GDPmannose 4,6-dehydratase